MIAPRLATKVEPLQNCIGDCCTDLPPRGSNAVMSRSQAEPGDGGCCPPLKVPMMAPLAVPMFAT
jgi:hypothetical protein